MKYNIDYQKTINTLDSIEELLNQATQAYLLIKALNDELFKTYKKEVLDKATELLDYFNGPEDTLKL